jgi:biopolymer transport protein ExbB/TolQ
MVLANVATLSGLLGTIYGLMFAFAAAGAGSGGDLAAGISTAMLTTLWGLVVAIPATLVYTFLSNKSQSILDDIDEHSVKLIHLLTGGK